MCDQKIIKHVEKLIEYEIHENCLYIKHSQTMKLMRTFGIKFNQITKFFNVKYMTLLFDNDKRFIVYSEGVKRMQCIENFYGDWETFDKKLFLNLNGIKKYTIKTYYS